MISKDAIEEVRAVSEEQTRQANRKRVECDEQCRAFDEPETLDEFVDAYEHWRNHDVLAGCSHAR